MQRIIAAEQERRRAADRTMKQPESCAYDLAEIAADLLAAQDAPRTAEYGPSEARELAEAAIAKAERGGK